MISIKEFLRPQERPQDRQQDRSQERDAARLLVIATLLEGISVHSPAGDPLDHERFQRDLKESIHQLRPETEPSDLLLMAGRTVQALEEHNRQAALRADQRSAELRAIVEMLTQTIATITAASGRSSAHLTGMQKDLQNASEIDDVRSLKSKLSDCLRGIESEIKAQNEETGATLNSLREQLQNSIKTLVATADPAADQMTGLPGRAQAERALTACCRSSEPTFALICVMDRLQLINERHGIAIGDKALRHFSKFVMRDARPEDLFFRWSGPTILALLPRTEPLEAVRLKVARAFAEKCEMVVETETRNLTLPLSSRWGLFPMLAAPRLLFGKLDMFISAPGNVA